MMDAKEQEFLKRLQATFRIEAEEHLRALSAGLIELEQTTELARRAQMVEILFREAHSLKGAARSVNLMDVESICQPLESVFAALKRQEIALSPPLFDLFHQGVDSIAQLVSSMDAQRTPSDRSRARDLVRQLGEASHAAAPPGKPVEAAPAIEAPSAGAARAGEQVEAAPVIEAPSAGAARAGKPVEAAAPPTRLPELVLAAEPAPLQGLPRSSPRAIGRSTGQRAEPPMPAAPSPQPAGRETTPPRRPGEGKSMLEETVRISTTKLDPLLLQAEEMIQTKIAASQRAADLHEIDQAALAWKLEWDKWEDQHTPQHDERQEANAARLDALLGRVTAVTHAFEQDRRALGRMVDDHLMAMKQVLMLPVSTLVEMFPKLVRDLARDQGKEVVLVIRGAEIEIDKRILEELKAPLIHLVRNCVDHGIEKAEERARKQKPAHGVITLTFGARDSRQVEILVSDDGAGIDVDQIKSAATRMGIISAEAAERLSTREALPLIFQSGLTTSPLITDLSGRGLGLAIVREKAEKLGGGVSVDTQRDVGTTFRLLLPLTLTTFRGILVRVHEQVFVLPITNVERALRASQEDIKTVETQETLQLDGRILSLVSLGDVLGLPARSNAVVRRDELGRESTATEVARTERLPIMVLASAEKRIAVYVDEVFAEEEVLVKGLGRQLSRVRNIAGVTILGTGKVVPILNVSDLLKSAVRCVGTAAAPVAAAEKAPTGRILVAEDSITSRTLLKNILQTAGYEVATAVDGADALTQLRSGEYDLVVSDVDMPRLSGFELTTKIRSDKKLGELPVVLVTALESREDRERGIDVGANAYIIKSSFDQSNLLEVISRLL